MKLGCIGVGNMGGALIGGYLGENPAAAPDTYLFDTRPDAAFPGKTVVCASVREVAENSDILILAVKPNVVNAVLREARPHLKAGAILVSIAAGISLSSIESALAGHTGGPVKAIRVMPNTPALAGAGMSALSRSRAITDEEFAQVKAIFDAVGRSEEVSEGLMDAVTGVSGSGPAYVYLFIEALADGAVCAGMPRDKAYLFAAQTVLGSARMVLETGLHPGALKDMVCSPGGTTIDAVRTLEDSGFRGAVIRAVMAAAEKSKGLG